MKKILAMLLVLCMVLSMVACTGTQGNNPTNGTDPTNGNNPTEGGNQGGDTTVKDTYTYNTYTTALGTNWNPHTWEMNSDSAVMGYIEAPLTDMTIADGETGEYQWLFVAATDIKDVTADHQDDLVKYGADQTDATAGYVYEIKLRPEMAWQNGVKINADTYIYSMKQMLDPSLRNYRANNYYSGESALAGAYKYFNSGAPLYNDLVSYPDGQTPVLNADPATAELYISLTATMTIASYTFNDFANDYTFVSKDLYKKLSNMDNGYGMIKITADNKEDVLTAMDQYLSAFGISIYDGDGNVIADYYNEFCFYFTGEYGEKYNFEDVVGLYKVDEYTIRYVCQTSYDYYYFLTSCTSNWLVYEELYEACKTYDEETGLTSSDYGTTLDKTMSYGPYKMTVLEDAKQMVFVQNENYFEYTKNADGSLSSTTETIGFKVNGEYVEQYKTQKVVINVMTDDAAKLAFLSGEIEDWSVSAEDAQKYGTSEQMYKVDETYTMRLFFHTNLEALKNMDAEGTNVNGVVLSNVNFRKAFSLSIDRSQYVTATAGFKPACFLINYLYYYDVYEDPASIYRNTDAAKQAIVDLYNIEYGPDKAYKNLDEAFAGVTGYNLTEAKGLMKTAHDELVTAGLYTSGDPITLTIALSAATADSGDQAQMLMLEQFLNAAAEGSGFGKITIAYKDNLSDRYGDVINGTYAIGRGAWGGAAFYPFTMFRVYCDPSYADIHESGCWNPESEKLTLTVNGEEVTMTWQEWSQSMSGTGAYANASNETKLEILAAIEQHYLEQYYCIPLCTYTACSMLSYKVSYFTENYSIMYGFGGLRLMQYNYTDAEWAEYVESVNHEIGY